MEASGNTVPSFTGAISLALGNAGGATLSGTGCVKGANVCATVANLTIDKVGTGYTLTATSGTLTQATSNAFNITAAPPPPATHLAFGVQPSDTQVGATITPAVTVTALDASGNTVPSFTGAISLALGNAGGATLSGNGPVNAVNGVATFANLTIDKVGTGYTLTATSGTLTQATSNAFSITARPPPPHTTIAYGVQPRNTQVGATITPTLTATALHASRNTVPTFTAAVLPYTTLFRSGATLSGNGPVNAVNGVATFANLTIDKVGTGYTLKTTSGTLTPATSNSFNITAAPPPTADLTATTTTPGTNQPSSYTADAKSTRLNSTHSKTSKTVTGSDTI